MNNSININTKTANTKTANTNTNTKTKKNKAKKTSVNKKALWEKFDTETKNETIECIYNSSGSRELCELCNNRLIFTDEGFLTCTNNTCGIIYKDVLDSSAEWRYYGSEDNNNSDPTRCGMPINPLL